MFNFREYVKRGFIEAVGEMADYKIRLNSAGYYDKGVLEASDLAEIQAYIESKNTEENTESEN